MTFVITAFLVISKEGQLRDLSQQSIGLIDSSLRRNDNQYEERNELKTIK